MFPIFVIESIMSSKKGKRILFVQIAILVSIVFTICELFKTKTVMQMKINRDNIKIIRFIFLFIYPISIIPIKLFV